MQRMRILRRWLDAAPAALAGFVAAERGRLAPWLPVLMAMGVVAYFSLRREPPRWPAPAAFAVLAGSAWLCRRVPLLPSGLSALAAVALGFALAQGQAARAPPLLDVPRRATIVQGMIRAVEPLPAGRRVTLEQVRLDGGEVLARAVRLRLRPADSQPLAVGDRIAVRALLQPPAPPAWPGGWDLQRDAFFAGLGAFGYALNPAERLQPGTGGASPLARLRAAVDARIFAVLEGGTGALASALLTGGTSAIPEADRAAFRDSGLAHLLAIAGLHIGIVMGTVFLAVRLGLVLHEQAALRWPTKQIAALAALAAGGGYLLLTGAHVPIQRSFAMACLVTLGVMVGRRALSLRGLAIAMAAVIAIAPDAVLGVSFQMSFSAVLALIAGYAALRPWLTRLHGDGSWRRRVGGHVVALALTSALAGTFSAPYGAHHFGHVQLYYVFANMVAVPLTAFWTLPLGMLALALMPVGLEALALVPMGWGIAAILSVGRFVSAWPQAVVAVPHLPGWGLGVFSLGLAWAGIWRGRVRHAGWAAMLLGLASTLVTRPPDVLVSSEARLIGLRTPDGLFVQKVSGASRFTLDSWLQLLAEKAAKALPAEPLPGLSCTGSACLLAPPGSPPALLVRGPAPPGACAAALVVSAEPLRLACDVPVIDRFSVWREGAHAAWLFPGGAVVVSDRALRGARPWVTPRPTRSAVPPGPALPMAPTDD